MRLRTGVNRSLFCATVCFLFGGAVGCATGMLCSDAALSALLSGGALRAEHAIVSALLWNLCVPACAFFLGGAALGLFLLPLLVMGYGMALGVGAVALAAASEALGGAALVRASAALLCVPPVLWLCACALRLSHGLWTALRSGGKQTFDSACILKGLALCMFLLLTLSLLEGLLLLRVD